MFKFIVLFLTIPLSLSAHDSKNCDVLENYDFTQFDSWKNEVIKNSSEYDLDSDFVSDLVSPYSVNKRVIENDKCQPEFTLTFSQYIDKRISDLRIKNGLNKKGKHNDLLKKIDNETWKMFSKIEHSIFQVTQEATFKIVDNMVILLNAYRKTRAFGGFRREKQIFEVNYEKNEIYFEYNRKKGFIPFDCETMIDCRFFDQWPNLRLQSCPSQYQGF